MTIKSAAELDDKPIEIDLRGEDGNAFVLVGKARRYAKDLGYSEEETENLINQMVSSDYENLIQIFDEHFGEYVTLYR